VSLVNHTPDADTIVAAALLYLVSNHSFDDCRVSASDMSTEKLATVFDTAMQHMEFFDAPLREFEHVSLTFDIALSASAFAQLKRHRMTTQSLQEYDPHLGVTVPPSIVTAGLEEEFRAHIGRTERLYEKLSTELPHVASYVLTNAHRRRVLVTTNLRELYHFIRLREDTHAQWDIRALAVEMRNQAARVMPLSTLLLCGKSDYLELFEKVFGRQPDVIPPVAPFSAQIKY
jgi:thymidylate synthase ThyX